jgi:hypothetical protein
MENTLNAIADPDDYETGGLKSLAFVQALAAACIFRNNL